MPSPNRHPVKNMRVRGMGIPDISAVLKISLPNDLKERKSTHYKKFTRCSDYDCLEREELWRYVGKKKNNLWLGV
jgi:hypothetical protein